MKQPAITSFFLWIPVKKVTELEETAKGEQKWRRSKEKTKVTKEEKRKVTKMKKLLKKMKSKIFHSTKRLYHKNKAAKDGDQELNLTSNHQ